MGIVNERKFELVCSIANVRKQSLRFFGCQEGTSPLEVNVITVFSKRGFRRTMFVFRPISVDSDHHC